MSGADGMEISACGGGKQGVVCEHLPALLTNMLKKKEQEWQENNKETPTRETYLSDQPDG